MDPATKKQPHPYDFVVFSWEAQRNQVSGYYLMYRLLVATFFLSTVVFGLSVSKYRNYWLIYLSDIGILLQTLHLVTAAAVPVRLLFTHQKDDGVDDTLPLLARFSMFLYNVTNVLILGISFFFWAGIAFIDREPKDTDFLVHGMNSIMSVSDIFISKRPCRLFHFHHSMAVLVPYFLFTVAYWAAGGRNEYGGSYIYPVLNWDNLPLTIPFVMGILTVGVIFFHTLVWTFHLLRDGVISCANKDVGGVELHNNIKHQSLRNNPA